MNNEIKELLQNENVIYFISDLINEKNDYKSRIEKAVELLKRYTDNESNYYVPVFELIDILNGKE